MAKFFRDGSGVYGLRRNDDEEARHPIPGGSTVIEFDEAQPEGVAIVESLCGKTGFNWQDHTIASGQIRRSGVAMTLPTDTSATGDRKFIKTNAAAILSALRAGTATMNQVQRVLAYLLRQDLRQG